MNLLKSNIVLLSRLKSIRRYVSYVPRHVLKAFLNVFYSLQFFRKRNYYEVLGIEKTATLDEIKNAFASETRKLHPDTRNAKAAPNSTEKFMELKEAYDFLRKPDKRKVYDRELEFSVKASREMFYENPHSDYDTIDLNIRGPGDGINRGPRPSINVTRFGHFFDPSKEMDREKRNERTWWYLGGMVLFVIIGNIFYVSFVMKKKKKVEIL